VSTTTVDNSANPGPSGVQAAASPRNRVLSALLHRPLALTGLCGVALLVLIAAVGPLLAPDNPDQTSSHATAPPSLAHWMGTDQLGRDVFSRMIVGTRISLAVGVGSTAIALAIGGLLGMLAGLEAGRAPDTVLMRAMDVIFAFPVLVFVPVLSGLAIGRQIHLGPVPVSQLAVLTGAISVVFVPVFARVARASTLAESKMEYMLAARAFGARRQDLILRNLLPNVAGPLMVQAAFSIPLAVITEAAVSFLGFGVQPPQASWGDILNDGRNQILLGDWWETVFPALAIVVTVLFFNFIGDALRDVLDPRARAREMTAAATGAVVIGDRGD